MEDGDITAVTHGYHNEKGLPEVDAAGCRVLPGFLDLHTHGAAGVDVNAADAEGLRTIGRFFASQGVTGWLCSVLTDTPEQTLWCMEQARQVIEGGPYDGAALLGIHLEGPCLSSEYKGAMPEHLLMHTADAELFATLSEGLRRTRALHHPGPRDPRCARADPPPQRHGHRVRHGPQRRGL